MAKKQPKKIYSEEVNSVQQIQFSRNNQNQNIEPISKIETQRKIKIIKRKEEVKFKLKRGKDTQGIHLRALLKYMPEFRSHYKLENCQNDKNYDIAKKQVQDVLKKNPTNQSLQKIFGGQPPTDKSSQKEKKQFIINRVNAKVLELIYQKYLLQIVFGTARIEDKLTIMSYIQEYRSRLMNPLLCGKIECPRPNVKQQKNPSKKRKNIQS